MITAQTHLQTLDPYESMYKYLDRVLERVKPELEKLFREYDIFWSVNETDSTYDYEITIEANVTELLGLDTECLWFDGVSEICNEPPVGDPEYEKYCNPDSPEYDDEKCERLFRECVENEIQQFKEENCGLPFRFAYNNPPMFLAYLSVWEDEDAYKLCCGVKLVFKYRNSVFKNVVAEIAESDNTVNYSAQQILAELKKVVEAVKALAP